MKNKIDIEHLKKEKEIFEVPDGYFDKLTSNIQARIQEESTPESSTVRIPRLAWVTPVIVVAIAAVFWFYPGSDPASANEMLAEIPTEELLAYLDNYEISEDEIVTYMGELDLADLQFDHEDTDLLNDINMDELEGIMDDFNLDIEDLENI